MKIKIDGFWQWAMVLLPINLSMVALMPQLTENEWTNAIVIGLIALIPAIYLNSRVTKLRTAKKNAKSYDKVE